MDLLYLLPDLAVKNLLAAKTAISKFEIRQKNVYSCSDGIQAKIYKLEP
jgi:hypothetical protein